MIQILLVDDEKKICEFIQACLENEGYNVDVSYDGKTAVDKFEKNAYNLIILDRMLPDISGEDICLNIRKRSNIPIIMLTAKIEDEDKIEGFNIGCDDYICKPFNIIELVCRVKAVLKRSCAENNKIIKYGDYFILNTLSHELIINNKDIVLTNTEYKILFLLSSNPNKIFTREELLQYAISEYYEKADRAIDGHIKNLRQKIEYDEGIHKVIHTVYGVGYKFAFKE